MVGLFVFFHLPSTRTARVVCNTLYIVGFVGTLTRFKEPFLGSKQEKYSNKSRTKVGKKIVCLGGIFCIAKNLTLLVSRVFEAIYGQWRCS